MGPTRCRATPEEEFIQNRTRAGPDSERDGYAIADIRTGRVGAVLPRTRRVDAVGAVLVRKQMID